MPIKIYPSKLDLTCACPAAPARNMKYPFEQSDASIRGADLHERTAMLLQNPDIDIDEMCNDIPEEDKNAVATCVEVANMLMPVGKKIVFIEEKLDLKFIKMTTGKPDLAYYDVASKTIAVVDWKFGKGQVPDPTENMQLKAYAVALTDKLAEQKLTVEQAYLVICQPCGTAKQSYRDVTFTAEQMGKWPEEIKQAIDAANAKYPVAIPGRHCKSMFCEAGKHGDCSEFKGWSEVKAVEKERVQVANAAFAVAGIEPVVVEAPDVQFPLVVLSEETVAKANDYLSQAQGLVLDENSANAMGLLLQEITKFESLVDKNRETVKKPVLNLGRAIDDAAKKALLPLREAKEAAKAKLNAWINEQAKIAKLEAQNQMEQQKALAEEATSKGEAPPPPPLPVPVKKVEVAGVTVKLVPEFEVIDFAKMPDTFKVTNEALLKKAIETKGVTEKDDWVKITWVEKASSSGRR